MSKRLTQADRDRGYHVLMYGLSEENLICKLPKEELLRRQKEIWESCYGDQKETAK